MIKARGGVQKMHSLRGDKVSRFLLNSFAYLDVLGSLSGGELMGDSCTSEWDLDDEIAEEDEYQVGCLLGFTTWCLHVLSNIAVLARRGDRERMMLSVTSVWRPSEDTPVGVRIDGAQTTDHQKATIFIILQKHSTLIK
jgi:hypothetical protein